eukprot:TRINITY_DN2286_c0_g1_i7.p2 TRINITY_DN2286_c0_g1~~TRINITY_DN2286_c0_g1_i7.p2  ORF type:complete len:314 (-),score=48.13 TRINITY_DN2286_c0_g1_i7:2236-3177(-)
MNTSSLPLDSIICGDSSIILASFPDACIDLTVTSPPYDNLRSYHNCQFTTEVFQSIARELYRITKSGGVVVWVVGDATIKGSESGTSFRQALYFMDIGFKLHDTMIYEKNTASFPASRTGTRYTQIFEYMFVFVKGPRPATVHLLCDKPNAWAGSATWGKITKRRHDGSLHANSSQPYQIASFSPRTNIWRYVVGHGFNSSDKASHQHPAIFPEKLAEDHILTWSDEGQVVLDPFCGSGTTCKMAAKHGRRYIGVDMSPEYCQLAESIVLHYQASGASSLLMNRDEGRLMKRADDDTSSSSSSVSSSSMEALL